MVRYARTVVNYSDGIMAEKLFYAALLLIVIEPPFPMLIIIDARGALPTIALPNALWMEPECVLASTCNAALTGSVRSILPRFVIIL